jgi:hypothetical protein
LGVSAEPAAKMETLETFMARNNHSAINYLKVSPSAIYAFMPL